MPMAPTYISLVAHLPYYLEYVPISVYLIIGMRRLLGAKISSKSRS